MSIVLCSLYLMEIFIKDLKDLKDFDYYVVPCPLFFVLNQGFSRFTLHASLRHPAAWYHWSCWMSWL